MRNIAVFGANGRVGGLVVNNLLERGHHVIAFVHNARGLKATEQLSIVEGDIHDPAAVEKALDGADAVISTLGSWGTPQKDILRSGMTHIIPAMHARGIKRIITLTGAEARSQRDTVTLLHRLAHLGASIAAGKILFDGEDHIKQLEASELEWTVLRSPVMNEKGSTQYALGTKRPKPWQTIHRHAVADALVQQLNDSHFYQQSPFINR